ncbi:MAG: hypothetical protein AB7L17_05865 [Ilumatobacteraceae bacterium]
MERDPARRHRRRWWVASIIVVALSACSTSDPQPTATEPSTSGTPATDRERAALTARLGEVDAAVTAWQESTDLAGARAAAERARNLIVGPAGPYYGDADGDGSIGGQSDIGLLPGLDGEAGIATDGFDACVTRDVLGGSWTDPAERWAILDAKIQQWSPGNNTFPSLPSHPQRIIGWATLALGATTLDEALEYGGHAHLHIGIASGAAAGCDD